MTSRERVVTALRRRIPDRVPCFAEFSPAKIEEFKLKYGEAELEDVFPLDVRYIVPEERTIAAKYQRYYPEELLHDPRFSISRWGIGSLKGSSYHFTKYVSPLQGKDLEDVRTYPYPQVSDFDWQGFAQKVEHTHASGLAVAGLLPARGGAIWEPAWQLRSQEEIFLDMMDESELAVTLFDKVAALARELAQAVVRAGADILTTADDIGTQRGMVMSPDMWRRWIKPRLASVIAAAKTANPDVLIFYHSDGNILPVIQDLIEIGVEILNPIQPECMDPAEIAARYGGSLSFWGTVGTQTTMPFGRPEEVKAVVKERIATVGKAGGFLIAPTHMLEPDVPWENIEAFFAAVKRYGAY